MSPPDGRSGSAWSRRVPVLLASVVFLALAGCARMDAPADASHSSTPFVEAGPGVVVPSIAGATIADSAGSTAPQSPAPTESAQDDPSADDADSSEPASDDGSADDTERPEPSLDLDVTPPASVDQAVAQGASTAAAYDIEQSIAVVDRKTGQLVAQVGGDVSFDTESLTKLFTAAYYLTGADDGTPPDADTMAQLRDMIEQSDDDVQIALWRDDIVTAIGTRYGLEATAPSGSPSPDNWGSDQSTAEDMATFLSRMSADPMVSPSLMAWMRLAQPTGLDGFDQLFGLNALHGDHGSKQGWSDEDYYPSTVHSVGWTPRYFVAILQRSYTADYQMMRETATYTATLIDRTAG